MNGRKALLPLAFVLILSLTGLSTGGQTVPPDHPSGACSLPVHVQHAGWDLCWQQDDVRGQGIELNQVHFQGDMAIWKIGFPFSITQYEDDAFGPFKDTLGQSFLGTNPGFGRGALPIDVRDCPRFLGQGIRVNDDHLCIETRDGPEPAVAIWGRYDIFNYRFLQGYVLDSRGVMEPFVRLGGLLTDGDEFSGGAQATNHFHHLFWRVDMDIGSPGDDGFQMHLRPHEAWNDGNPYHAVDDGNGTSGGVDCTRFGGVQGPPRCHEADADQVLVDPLATFPEACRQQVHNGTTGWCDARNETALTHHPALVTKWRTHDATDTNEWGNTRSFESTGLVGVPPDGNFTTFDLLALQYAGDSQEIGFNVPPFPLKGDRYLHDYLDPREAIHDPVLWLAGRAYHDTRDEEVPTMSYHHISFEIQPRNFLGENPGEDTYNPRPLLPSVPVQPPPLPIEPNPPGGIEV